MRFRDRQREREESELRRLQIELLKKQLKEPEHWRCARCGKYIYKKILNLELCEKCV